MYYGLAIHFSGDRGQVLPGKLVVTQSRVRRTPLTQGRTCAKGFAADLRGKVETANSIWDSRVKDAIEKNLAAKGWTELPSGGNVTVVVVERTHIKPQTEHFFMMGSAVGTGAALPMRPPQ
jgi:hypothetical protein